MPPFRFRLSTLLRLRENLRDECRQQLSVARRAEDIIRSRIAELDDQLSELRHHCEVSSRPGTINVDQLLDAERYEMTLKAQRQAADEQRQAVEMEIERRRQSLVEADREVKTLEKLRQQQAHRHQVDENRREIKQFDAAAIQRVSVGEEN